MPRERVFELAQELQAAIGDIQLALQVMNLPTRQQSTGWISGRHADMIRREKGGAWHPRSRQRADTAAIRTLTRPARHAREPGLSGWCAPAAIPSSLRCWPRTSRAFARNVRVTFDPPLPAGHEQADMVEAVQRTLAKGLRSLAPNRLIRWSLGAGCDLLSVDVPQVRKVRIEGDGPHGPLPVLENEIDISEWRQARDAPDGSMHHVRGAIRDLTTAVVRVETTLKRVVEPRDVPD